MKLGFVSAILDQWDFAQVMDTAGRLGFDCVELACWPRGGAERRYAGVSHLDAAALDEKEAGRIREMCRERGVEISALAYYPNPMDGNPEKRAAAQTHLKAVIRAAGRLKVGTVGTFIGRDQNKTVEENLELFRSIWPELIHLAEDCGVRIAIENCPMYFDAGQWPGGQNLATTPAIWRELFREIPSASFGLNYDPSHFVWQMMDYIEPLYEFRERIFHVHYKDIKLYPQRLKQVGTMAYPLEYMSPKLPGLGDVDWGRYVSALTDIGYNGCSCIEVEDRAFETGLEGVERALRQSKRYLEQFVI